MPRLRRRIARPLREHHRGRPVLRPYRCRLRLLRPGLRGLRLRDRRAQRLGQERVRAMTDLACARRHDERLHRSLSFREGHRQAEKAREQRSGDKMQQRRKHECPDEDALRAAPEAAHR